MKGPVQEWGIVTFHASLGGHFQHGLWRTKSRDTHKASLWGIVTTIMGCVMRSFT